MMITQSGQTTHPLYWLPLSKHLSSMVLWGVEPKSRGFVKNDIFRQLPLRLLGYGVPVGEALLFRASSSSDLDASESFCLLGYSFILAHCAYVAVDVAKTEVPGRIVIAFFDTLLWECLASCMFPTFITYCVCRLTDALLGIAFEPSSMVRHVIPVLAGIAILPLIVIPVDTMVDNLMNDVLRPLYNP